VNFVESIEKIAIQAVTNPDYAFFVRQVCRWFSKQFSTPLNEVENYDLAYVLQHYFEEKYEALQNLENGEEEIHNKIIYLLETPAEREQRIQKELDKEIDYLKKALEEELLKKTGEGLKGETKAIPAKPLREEPKEESIVNLSFVEDLDAEIDSIPDPTLKKNNL
jgi:hypothetical protein